MARAIGLETMLRDAQDKTPRDGRETMAGGAREELQRKLEQAPEQHAEALLESYDLLQQLHDSGVLRLLRGALSSGDKILETTVNAASSAEGIRALRNAIILGKMLGSINPELLQSFAVATSQTLGAEPPIVEPPGLFKLLAEFRQPELRRSMALINKFLDILGTELKARGRMSLVKRSTGGVE
jgi:uncharacterized protein YjgD (DUF1641 family)